MARLLALNIDISCIKDSEMVQLVHDGRKVGGQVVQVVITFQKVINFYECMSLLVFSFVLFAHTRLPTLCVWRLASSHFI